MTVLSPALDTYLDARRAEIEAALDRALPRPEQCRPPIVGEAMRYSVFAGGKRLRPVLTLAAAEAVAGAAGIDEATARDHAMPAACAIELIHTYSLVHDDLPAMDDDTLRRGRPTAHVVFGEGMAILAGDGLLTLAFEVLSGKLPATRNPQLETTDTAQRSLRAIQVIAGAAGVAGMVGGQAIDLQAVGDASRFGRDALREMHARKTGALIRAAATTGAILAGAPDTIVQAIDAYAAQLGLAFQIVDDVLDVEGTLETLGKAAGSDRRKQKVTYPDHHGLAASKIRAGALCREGQEALAPLGEAGTPLRALAEFILRRTA
jgi:geranylgeranyl diphosphate synthase type II